MNQSDRFVASEILIMLGGTVLILCTLFLAYALVVSSRNRKTKVNRDLLLLEALRALREQ